MLRRSGGEVLQFDFVVGGASSADEGQIGGLNSKLSSSEGCFFFPWNVWNANGSALTIEDRAAIVLSTTDWGRAGQ
jgi:hypothetical protein